MEKFTKLEGVAAPLPLVNVDTDMIIPKQFLKTIKRTGLGVNLFDEMRYTTDGEEIEDFVLNQPAYRNAKILVAGENFGCGSSRLPQDQIDQLMEDAGKGANAVLTVDLMDQEITRPDGSVLGFEVDAFKKECLLNGLDDIGLTLKKTTAIDAFEKSYGASAPWL